MLMGVELVMVLFDVYCDLVVMVWLICDWGIMICYFVFLMLLVFLVLFVLDGLVMCCVFCLGEELIVDQCDCFYVWMQVELYNLYGLIEVVVDVSFWFVSFEDCENFILIGWLVWNMVLNVLDDWMCLVFVGFVGYLYLGGV